MKIPRKLANEISNKLLLNDEQRAQLITNYCYTIEEIKQMVYYSFCLDYGQYDIEGVGLISKDIYDAYLSYNSDGGKELEISGNFESDLEPVVYHTEVKFHYITDTDMKDFELIEQKLIEGVKSDNYICFFGDEDYRNSLINP